LRATLERAAYSADLAEVALRVQAVHALVIDTAFALSVSSTS